MRLTVHAPFYMPAAEHSLSAQVLLAPAYGAKGRDKKRPSDSPAAHTSHMDAAYSSGGDVASFKGDPFP